MYLCMYVCMYVCIFMCVCMYDECVCVCVCVCVVCGAVCFIKTPHSTPVISLTKLLDYDGQELSSLSIEHISFSHYIKDATCVI